MKLRILITGSRELQSQELVLFAINNTLIKMGETNPKKVTIVHGGSSSGADLYAAEACRRYGFKEKVYEVNRNKFGDSAALIRNQKMVDGGADICLAFPRANSYGTWDVARRAEKFGIDVIVFKDEL